MKQCAKSNFCYNYFKMKNLTKVIIASFIVLITTGIILKTQFKNRIFSTNTTSDPSVEVVAKKLEIPWALTFLPDKSILFTERPGRVRLIDKNGILQSSPIYTIKNIKAIGEGGLLGIALHPNFSKNNFVYLYYTYSENNSNTLNRVVRMNYQNGELSNETIIVDKIPGSSNHNGGRLKFGPDGYLYITTGDAQNPSQAQDKNSLGGKILRVNENGKPAPENPFRNLIYSYGHRNPQGLAWDSKGNLWATEHGRSGIQSGLDEINQIIAGRNYGWPIIQGDQTKSGMETSKLNSGPNITWAPSGAVFVGNSLFFGGLRGNSLYEAVIDNNHIVLKKHLDGQFGRLRDVVLSPDGFLYVTTSNRDGRGIASQDDDQILKINPKKLN